MSFKSVVFASESVKFVSNRENLRRLIPAIITDLLPT